MRLFSVLFIFIALQFSSLTWAAGRYPINGQLERLTSAIQRTADSNPKFVRTTKARYETLPDPGRDRLIPFNTENEYSSRYDHEMNYYRLGSYKDLLSLIPEGKPFVLITSKSSPELYDVIDEIKFNILSTSEAAKICVWKTNGALGSIQVQFGLSNEKTIQLEKQYCPWQKIDKISSKENDFFKYGMFDRGYDITKSEYAHSNYNFLVFDDADLELKFESWTPIKRESFPGKSTSYIAINLKKISIEEVYRRIAHEFYMQNDVMNNYQVLNILESVNLNANVERFWTFLLHPQVNLTFNIIRAYDFENTVVKELGLLDSEQLANVDIWNKKTCESKFLTMWPHTPTLARSLQIENAIYTQTMLSKFQVDVKQVQLDKYRDVLSERFSDNGTNRAVCESLERNHIVGKFRTPQVEYSLFTPGPRPPIGRGTGTETESLDVDNVILKMAAEEKAQAEAQAQAKKKLLGTGDVKKANTRKLAPVVPGLVRKF